MQLLQEMYSEVFNGSIEVWAISLIVECGLVTPVAGERNPYGPLLKIMRWLPR